MKLTRAIRENTAARSALTDQLRPIDGNGFVPEDETPVDFTTTCRECGASFTYQDFPASELFGYRAWCDACVKRWREGLANPSGGSRESSGESHEILARLSGDPDARFWYQLGYQQARFDMQQRLLNEMAAILQAAVGKLGQAVCVTCEETFAYRADKGARNICDTCMDVMGKVADAL